MPGRPRKPDNVTHLSGTAQPCRLHDGIELPTLTELPPAPSYLPNEHALREWNRLGPILLKNKLLTEGSIGALEVMCTMYGVIFQQASAGVNPPAASVTAYRNMVNDFGLTPVAASKVKMPDQATPGNPFASNGRA